MAVTTELGSLAGNTFVRTNVKGSLCGDIPAPLLSVADFNADGRVDGQDIAELTNVIHNGQYYARPTGPQGSGILTSMSLANGLAVVAEDKTGAKAGDVVPVMMLDWNEEMGQ